MRFADFISQQNKILSLNDDASQEKGLGQENMEMILNIVQKINNSLILEEVLNLVMYNAIKLARAERGFLLLLDDSNDLRYKVGMNINGEFLPEEDFEISKSVVKDAFDLGETIYIEDARADRNFQSRQSIMNLELQTIICTPLITNGEKIGVIYVDSKKLTNLKKSETIRMFEILAGHAAIAIRNAKLYHNLDRAFNEVQEMHEKLIKSERLVLKKELNAQIGQEVQNFVHLALLENESVLKRIQRINENQPVDGETLEQLIQKLEIASESIRKIQRYAQALIASTRFEVSKNLGDINRSIRNIVSYIKKTKKFKEVTFELNLDKVPLLEYDHEQIEQVIINLISNSVEKKSDCHIRISTFHDQESNQVVVKINDNGPGIPQDIQKQLFIHKINTGVEGKGYGLLIVKKIIDNHNGRIYCVSEPNKGATFYFSLPIV
ncbi:MAG: ATP-binding protein [Ignavibacteria bacterium]|jgi:K+-sensing histidine kinase KdpD|nr:ATP-binding protein [Ignavibacteria bacterium]MDH7528289.1 ATP-binding protein [Ignavibacteria bacterium]